jgi:fumarate hydratase class II
MGEIQVPVDKYWGAQTQRSLENFEIGTEKMPSEIITAFAILKKAAALVNMQLGIIDKKRGTLITTVCDEILSGKLDCNFPLVVWQTGSGTHTNMNVNEVIANRANELATEKIVHPNDHVNRGQSSNDTFPTAMHIASVNNIERKLLPQLRELKKTLEKLSEENAGVIKVGRTHLQDATPLTFGQEISGWCEMLNKSEQMISSSLIGLKELALGGTAVGTGLNTHPKFGELSAVEISNITGIDFRTARNKFHALTSKDGMVFCHGALKALAANLMKIANDIRLLASGPRCGIGEIFIPENEPGSSIMPGKVNPTQCEAMTMVAVQVIANDVAVGMAASQGNFELNVFMPVCIYNFLQSVRLLADAMRSFEKNCVSGIKPNLPIMRNYFRNSLMLVTALTPIIGYENAAKTARMAYSENIALKNAAIKLGFITAEEFNKAVCPENMLNPHG